MGRSIALLAFVTVCVSTPASAQQVFAGVYAHEVDTPLTLRTYESGVDLVLGYRFAPIEQLRVVGRPAPYVVGSVNTAGDTSFVGAGLSWTIGKGPVYLRPGIGLVVHDGPSERVVDGEHTELGSRVLFEPEIGVGYRLGKVAVEASWMHISQGRLFDSQQNPGIDMVGIRLSLDL